MGKPEGYAVRTWVWRGETDADTLLDGPFDTLTEARQAAKAAWIAYRQDGMDVHNVAIHEIVYDTDPLYPPSYMWEVTDREVEEVEEP